MSITEERWNAMHAALDAVRSELHAIQGVVGSGLGLAPGVTDVIEIQLYVESAEDMGHVLEEAQKFLSDIPLGVYISQVPEAGAN